MKRKRSKKILSKSAKRMDFFSWKDQLFERESDLALSIFRICFGVVLIISTLHIWDNLELNYINQFFAYKYQGFEWVQLLDERILRIVLVFMFTTSGFLLLGILTRWSSLVFLFGYTYFFLLDASYYNNHYYVLILLLILFVITNGGRSFSFLHLILGKPLVQQSERWKTWIFQIQIFIIYFFGGLAKLNYDWLTGGTMECILTSGADFHEKGDFFQTDFAIYFYTWAGLLFDLIVGFLLFSKYWKLKLIAVFSILAFNIMNAIYFKIGIFPYMMIAATILFFNPKDFNRLFAVFGIKPFVNTPQTQLNFSDKKFVHIFLILYLTVQCVLPLRHHLIEGNVDWTGEGKKFAWRMKQPCKIPEEFNLNFGHPDPNVDIGLDFRLNISQMNELLYYPEHIVQLRDFLLEYVDPAIKDELVFLPKISASMNSRKAKPLYDNKRYNLMEVKDKMGRHNDWITSID